MHSILTYIRKIDWSTFLVDNKNMARRIMETVKMFERLQIEEKKDALNKHIATQMSKSNEKIKILNYKKIMAPVLKVTK